MRRVLQHVLAAAGISALTGGAVVGSLSSSSAEQPFATVAAPVVSRSAPEIASPANPLTMGKRQLRAGRDTRGGERGAAEPTLVAGARDRTLIRQRQAIQAEQATMKQQQAALKAKRAAVKQRQAAEAKKKAALAKKRQVAATAGRRDNESRGRGNPREIARQMMADTYGWGSSQFSCYNNIIMRESEWVVDATNRGSGAYGIPQALPGTKMASAGPDWRTNPATQVKWGLAYVKDRYGTPCNAWGFKSSHGWY